LKKGGNRWSLSLPQALGFTTSGTRWIGTKNSNSNRRNKWIWLQDKIMAGAYRTPAFVWVTSPEAVSAGGKPKNNGAETVSILQVFHP
jgi:hypothetical protein